MLYLLGLSLWWPFFSHLNMLCCNHLVALKQMTCSLFLSFNTLGYGCCLEAQHKFPTSQNTRLEIINLNWAHFRIIGWWRSWVQIPTNQFGFIWSKKKNIKLNPWIGPWPWNPNLHLGSPKLCHVGLASICHFLVFNPHLLIFPPNLCHVGLA